MFSGVKLIVFDWDDTFTHGATAGYMDCYHAVVAELGLDLSVEEEHKRVVARWGSTQEEEIKSLTEGFDVDQVLANKIYETHLFGDTFVSRLSLVDGARELLEQLYTRYELAIATGLSGELLRNVIMPKFYINSEYFSTIFSVYDLEHSEHAKPHPFMLQEIMRNLGYTSEETIMVGDAKNDVLMAQACGVEPIVVLSGHLSKEEADTLGVATVVPLVSDISKFL